MAVHGTDFCVCVQVEQTCRLALLVEKRQCHPPLIHVDKTVYDSVIEYMLLFLVVLRYLAKLLAH